MAYLNKADILYEMGRLNDSIYAYKEILLTFDKAQHPKTFNKARYGLAWCYLKIGKFKEAIEEFKGTLEGADNALVRVSSQIQIADTYQETGRLDDALDMYNDVLKNNPNTIYADYIQFQIGISFLKKKDLDSAMLALRQLKKSFPSSKLIPQAQYYLAVSYFSQEDYAEAKNLLEDFIENFPQNDFIAKAYYLHGKCFFNEARYQEALEVFTKVSKEYKDAEIEEFVLIDIGNVYFNLSKYDEAKKVWNDFFIRYPQSSYRPSVALYLGGVYEKENNYIEAEKYYLRVAEEYRTESWGQEAQLSLGHLYWAMGNLDKAAEFFYGLSSVRNPLGVKGKLYLADVTAEQGDTTTALKLYNELIEPQSVVSKVALVSKANLLTRLKDHHQAITVFRQAIAAGVDTPDVVFSLASALEKAGRNLEAIEEYLKVAYMFDTQAKEGEESEASEFRTRAYFRIARIYEEENNIPEAKKIYQKIIDSGAKEAKIAKTRLDELGR